VGVAVGVGVCVEVAVRVSVGVGVCVVVGVGVMPEAASTTDSKRVTHWSRACGVQLVKNNSVNSAAIPKRALFFIRFLTTIPL